MLCTLPELDSCPSFLILKTIKHSVLETESLPSSGEGSEPSALIMVVQ
jgi:hypothetical protein